MSAFTEDDDDADDLNVWQRVLDVLRDEVDEDEFRRWFGETAYASDSGDQITVWVPSEPIRRYLDQHFRDAIDEALAAVGRGGTHVRFVVTGVGEDEGE